MALDKAALESLRLERDPDAGKYRQRSGSRRKLWYALTAIAVIAAVPSSTRRAMWSRAVQGRGDFEGRAARRDGLADVGRRRLHPCRKSVGVSQGRWEINELGTTLCSRRSPGWRESGGA